MSCVDLSPVQSGDAATGGGGLSFYNTIGATIDHCSFTNNSLKGDNTGGGGGVLFYAHQGGATVTNSNFTLNSIVGALAGGGGMYHYQSPNLVMSNCIFTNNTVQLHLAYFDFMLSYFHPISSDCPSVPLISPLFPLIFPLFPLIAPGFLWTYYIMYNAGQGSD